MIIAIRATNARSIAPTFKANPKPSEAPFAAASITFSLSTLSSKVAPPLVSGTSVSGTNILANINPAGAAMIDAANKLPALTPIAT